MSNNFRINNFVGLAFGGVFGIFGGMFLGILIGAVTGWASGVFVGVNVYSTALVGAGGGAIIGMLSGLVVGALAGNVSSPEENKLLGRKVSKVLRLGFPAVIVILFMATIATIPIHPYLLNNFIVPMISRPPNIPEKQVLLPDGYINVFHFSDKIETISTTHQRGLFIHSLWLLLPGVIILSGVVTLIKSVTKKEPFVSSLKGLFAILFGIVWVGMSWGWIEFSLENKASSTQVYQEYQDIFQNHQYQVVEGPVKVLHVFPPGGHDAGDIIVVDNIEFEIRPYSDALFYDKPIVNGGILTNGRYVRIYYYEDRILAIDLKPKSE